MPSPQNNSLQKTVAVLLAFIAWFSILFQLYINTVGTANFFSYFTVLCNLLIAISLTFSALLPISALGRFFTKLSVQSAIALYIFIVAVVYNTVLRGLLPLTGWDYFLDNMVHVVNPVLYILYWLFFRTKDRLEWKDGIIWLLFPLLYLIYSLVRGSFVNWYPYPFLNAQKFGYPKVFSNISIMLLVFLVAGFILISTTRSLRSSKG